MTSPTRAALERLMETWRQTAYAIERVTAYTPEARAYDMCANELAALLTAEGPAPTEPPDTGNTECVQCGGPAVLIRGTEQSHVCFRCRDTFYHANDLARIETRTPAEPPPSREALAARLTNDVLHSAMLDVESDYESARTVLLDALCPQEPT
jgi:hypothetical protein